VASDFYAHSPADKTRQPPDGWQLLVDHLRAVALLAEQMAREARPSSLEDKEDQQREKEVFHAGAFWAGLLHDLGKYRPEFQQMIRGRRPKSELTRHKQAGAAAGYDRGHRLDIAFAIAGHHGGLPDLSELQELLKGPSGRDVANRVWEVAGAECPELTQMIPAWQAGQDVLRFDLLVRLLFSCLVDADWKDTTAFHRRGKDLPPEPTAPALEPAAGLQSVLDYIGSKALICPDAHIASIRREVLEAALRAANQSPGLFAMTVPTGGGKTLSALAFALAHAQRHGLRRIIYVAPYLTIIEQNAREIRRALQAEDNSDVVFEHHSLAEPPGGDSNEPEAEEIARRAENWDAPVIVTTSVQFFESLFSNRPGQCRKLHNIARSVVILDECQTLPPDLIVPTCSMLSHLADIADCTLVLCTATQPAWTKRDDLPEGLSGVREIVPTELRLYERLRRVHVHWPARDEAPLGWAEVVARMAERSAALCIVNTKRAARELFEELRQFACDDALHLSTAMCPAHRLEVLDEVRRRLAQRSPCWLVTTQLIEAGVDVDFPLVLREMAPLEAIIQAAGRCNREGLLNGADGTPGGQAIVFRSREGKLPSDRWYKAGRATVEQDFLAAGREPDIGRPEMMQEYFRRLYRTGELDQHQIQDDRRNKRFVAVAGKYRLIDEDTVPVVVATWDSHRDEIERLLEQLRRQPSKQGFRRLGSFQVNLRRDELMRSSEVVADRSGVSVWWGPYDPCLGLTSDGTNILPAV
jgi:CRISPR-associated endonuclease/helicase Cas3